MDPLPTLYRLKEIRDRHIILQSPAGGLRVVSTEGLTDGIVTNQGVKFTNSNVVYTISVEDYQQIKDHLSEPHDQEAETRT
jgi:hypothetical protein